MASAMHQSVEVHDVYNVFDLDADKPWQVLSHYFPDKIGGRPAWLSLKTLPSSDELACSQCKKPCVFLLQKYAPTDLLHRTIFVFVCRDPACCRSNASQNFIVLRSQLPFDNEYYAKDPPNEDYYDMTADYPRADKFTSLCIVCGCSGSKKCGRCHQTNYCSKDHQKAHWSAAHKFECTLDCEEIKDASAVKGVLFPEYILDIPDDSSVYSSDNDEETRDLVNSLDCGESSKFSLEELEQSAADSAKHDDKLFEDFKKSIKGHPKQLPEPVSLPGSHRLYSPSVLTDVKTFKQVWITSGEDMMRVLRYYRNGSPLWVTDKTISQPESTAPNCERCGAKRSFEFQVMPQLLNHLEVDEVGDSIDWATLVVYTCSSDCDTGGRYVREFISKQDY